MLQARWSAIKADDRHFPGSKCITRILNVVARLQYRRDSDQKAESDEAVLAEPQWTQEPLTASDRHAQRDHARSEHTSDEFFATNLGFVENLFWSGQIS